MYIPSSTTGDLYLLDLNDFKIKDSVSIGGNIKNILVDGDELYLVNEDSNSVYVVDKRTLLPDGVLGVDDMPHGLDVDKLDEKLYIPCSKTILRVDMKSKQIDAKIETNLKSWHLKLNKKRREIYVTTIEGKVLILDEETFKVKNIIEDYILPIDIVVDDVHNRTYVSDMGYKAILVLDNDTNTVVNRIEIDGYPQGLCLIENNSKLLVSDTKRSIVLEYDALSLEYIKSIQVGKEPTTIVCL